jgi:DNA transformation protein and related proteins
MKELPSFVIYLLEDVFMQISGITAKSMFGGYGLYKDRVFFAIVDQDEGRVYFKVDNENLEDYKKNNYPQFVYQGKGKEMRMNYYEVPLEILENKEELPKWVEKSYQAGLRGKKNKK